MIQDHQQQFQNAGQNGSFSYAYTAVGNNSGTFFVLALMLALLIALLQSEARCRNLLERHYQELLSSYQQRQPEQ
jgi:hypothetical protein